MAAKPVKAAVSCLIQNCGRKIQSRGLCSNHYQSAQELVKKKETTWEELEAHALAKPVTRNTGLIFGLLAAARASNGVKKAAPKKKPAKKVAAAPAEKIPAEG